MQVNEVQIVLPPDHRTDTLDDMIRHQVEDLIRHGLDTVTKVALLAEGWMFAHSELPASTAPASEEARCGLVETVSCYAVRVGVPSEIVRSELDEMVSYGLFERVATDSVGGVTRYRLTTDQIYRLKVRRFLDSLADAHVRSRANAMLTFHAGYKRRRDS